VASLDNGSPLNAEVRNTGPPGLRPEVRGQLAGAIRAPLQLGTLTTHPNRRRASAAPWVSAPSLASATSRRIGAMPQLVHARMRSFGT
jgi:hypothetical protein